MAQATSGPYAGQFVQFTDEATPLSFVASESAATVFIHNSDSTISVSTDSTGLWNTNADSLTLVFASTDPSADGYPLITCQTSNGLASGTLTCASSNGDTTFMTCPVTSGFYGVSDSSLLIVGDTSPGTDCQALDLIAVPACG